jgi:hypothetical protein
LPFDLRKNLLRNNSAMFWAHKYSGYCHQLHENACEGLPHLSVQSYRL